MIYVGGLPFPANDSSSSYEGGQILNALLEHPVLVSASCSFNLIPERKFSASEDSGSEGLMECRWVYIFQREYATVDPARVDLVGTDEATTCVGLVIRDRKSGLTSVAHLDSPDVVEGGLIQMLSLFVDLSPDCLLDVHLIGGFDDSSQQPKSRVWRKRMKYEGYSFPLCDKIVETLEKSNRKFEIQTLHILGNNTRQDSEGNAYPIFSGFVVEPSTGSIFPANFDRTSRCPDEVVRRIRVTAAYEDPNWNCRLLDTYDPQTDQFLIAPCKWSLRQREIAMMLKNHSDTEILLTCSTSPSAEGPDFVENERRKWAYLIQHPHWRETFPLKQPRVFQRTAAATWRRLPIENDNCQVR
ncbi:hypothetical protein M9H77_00827 [Catharanthus roseus]|uniref:Uncharacterized protein n=1 Tax=Catharanthus roseus TaxID=4058 RepID=A0ACC0C3Z4_CATRO|nr:hypothetical protein M9H77_00827 [Catharanthus roseus]